MQLQRAKRLEAAIPALSPAHYRTQLLALRSEAGAAHRAIMDARFAERKPYVKARHGAGCVARIHECDCQCTHHVGAC